MTREIARRTSSNIVDPAQEFGGGFHRIVARSEGIGSFYVIEDFYTGKQFIVDKKSQDYSNGIKRVFKNFFKELLQKYPQELSGAKYVVIGALAVGALTPQDEVIDILLATDFIDIVDIRRANELVQEELSLRFNNHKVVVNRPETVRAGQLSHNPFANYPL